MTFTSEASCHSLLRLTMFLCETAVVSQSEGAVIICLSGEMYSIKHAVRNETCRHEPRPKNGRALTALLSEGTALSKGEFLL